MRRSLYTIIRLVLVFIPVLLALSYARAQVDTVYTGQTSTWVVQDFDGVSYEWELYDDVTSINFATDPGNCPLASANFVGGINTGDSVNIYWAVPGTYFLRVMGSDSCTNNLRVAMIEVLESTSEAVFLEPEPICPGDTAWLTVVITGGLGPWSITYTNGSDTLTESGIEYSPYTFPVVPTPSTTGSYEYWIISITSGTGLTNEEDSEPVTLIVLPQPNTSPIYRYDPTASK